MDWKIRKIKPEEVPDALFLVEEVFFTFEAPIYPPEGVETFQRDILRNAAFKEACQTGICPLYGAFDGQKLIGIMGMRQSKTHINLAFVKEAYHRKGVASALFRFLVADQLQANPFLSEITVNSSPYGKAFYLRMGFVPLLEEQQTDGIRYIPMKYIIGGGNHDRIT